MRYTVVRDWDGHQYLIKADDKVRFDYWMEIDIFSSEDNDKDWNWEYNYFNGKRFEGGSLTFTDPELDGKKMV